MPWLTSRLSAPTRAANTGICSTVPTLVAPRATLVRCQITLNSPSLLAVVNTASASGVPRTSSSWSSAQSSKRCDRSGQVHAGVSPKAAGASIGGPFRIAAERRTPRPEGTDSAQRRRVRLEVAGEAGPLDRLPHRRGAGGDERGGLLGRCGLDDLAAAQVQQANGGRHPAEHLLAEQGVEAHAGHAAQLPVRRRGPGRSCSR